MINYIKRKDLDIVKYDTCIGNSTQSNIYGFSWYLDIVADNWDALVLDDYDAVMPIPWNKKMGLKYISQPFFCQQLGVYSVLQESSGMVKEFIDKIPLYFLKITYQLNSYNNCSSTLFNKKTNYILSLQNQYEDLRKNYRKDRKYRINQAKKQGHNLVSVSSKRIIPLAMKYYDFMNISEEGFVKLEQLIEYTLSKKKGFIKGVLDDDEKILGACFFLKSKNRIIYLFSVSTPEGKKEQIASLIIDSVIKEYANTFYLLDFEGSMIPGIASFYKSFGGIKEEYYLLNTNKIKPSFRFFKR